jgi:uncharacterized protein
MTEALKSNIWYREPWAWIVMSGPAVVVVASFVSAFLAVRGADPVVDEDYYERGLHINAELAQDQQAARLHLESDLQIFGLRRGDEVRVRVISAQPLRDTTLRIRLTHQGSAFTERSAVLGRVPGAPSTATFYGQWLQAPDDDLTVAAGNWRAVIEASNWRIEGPAGGDVHLRAE